MESRNKITYIQQLAHYLGKLQQQRQTTRTISREREQRERHAKLESASARGCSLYHTPLTFYKSIELLWANISHGKTLLCGILYGIKVFQSIANIYRIINFQHAPRMWFFFSKKFRDVSAGEIYFIFCCSSCNYLYIYFIKTLLWIIQRVYMQEREKLARFCTCQFWCDKPLHDLNLISSIL